MGYGSPGGASTFLDLLDTPETYTGQALKLFKVNAGETASVFDLLLSFTDWYAGGAPTSYPWEFEAILPYTPGTEGHFFSPLLKNALEQYYCYLVGFEKEEFYKYNLTTKQWYRLANLVTARTTFVYRPLALSPDGKKLACTAGNGNKLEIYDIEANTWIATAAAPQIDTTDASLSVCVWETDDKIWVWARAYIGGTWHCKFFRYTISTTTWDQFTNDITPATTNPQCVGIKDDGTILYAAGCGANYYAYTKYVVATDTYSGGSMGSQRRALYSSDRRKCWFTFEGDYAFHYLDCDDESLNYSIFPTDPQRDKPSNWSFAAFENKAAIFHARSAAPRNMSYKGTGSWRLAQKTLTDYNLVVFKKPNDGFAISAVDKVNNYFVPIFLFSTLALPAGTWEFFYPKDGDYTKLKISGSELK